MVVRLVIYKLSYSRQTFCKVSKKKKKKRLGKTSLAFNPPRLLSPNVPSRSLIPPDFYPTEPSRMGVYKWHFHLKIKPRQDGIKIFKH